MKDIEIKISELQQFADIMAVQDDQWLPRFKKWFQSTIKMYCRNNSIMLVSGCDENERYNNMPIDDLSEALYSAYYSEVIKLTRYEPDKVDWWNNVIDNYEISHSAYVRFCKKGVMYIVKNLKKFRGISKRLKSRNIAVTMVDLSEIAFSRYAAEGRGNYRSYEAYMR